MNFNPKFKNKFSRSIYIYIYICTNASSKGNFKGKKILRISLLLPTSWSQASFATVTYHPSYIAFLSVHFSFGKRENIPWIEESSVRESFDRRKPRNRWPGAKSIWELIRDDCGRRGAIHEIAGSFVHSLVSILFLRRFSPSSSSSRRDKFPREDAPLCRLALSHPSLRGLESCEKLPIDRETIWRQDLVVEFG